MRTTWRDGDRQRIVDVTAMGGGRFRVAVDETVLELEVERMTDGRLRLSSPSGATLAQVTAAEHKRFVRLGHMDFVLERSQGDAEIDPQRELLGYVAFVRVMLGDKDEALRLLDQYLVANPKHREGFRKIVHWWWRPLQDDPRFKALIGAR